MQETVLILMSTYNGENYLVEQINSILSQVNVTIELLVRDDGSTDTTCTILDDYQNKGKLKWYTGANLRPAMSFMDLVFKCPSKYEYYAFADQDDIWQSDKIYRAVCALRQISNPNKMYFSIPSFVDSTLLPIKNEFYLPKTSYSFAQTFVKNIVIGCTLVFSRDLLELVRLYRPKYVPMHDRWIYLVCIGTDGTAYYDRNSYIYYRRHANNASGEKRFLQKASTRVKRILRGNNSMLKTAEELKIGYQHQLTYSCSDIIKRITGYKINLANKVALLRDKKFRFSFKNGRLIDLTDVTFTLRVLLGTF